MTEHGDVSPTGCTKRVGEELVPLALVWLLQSFPLPKILQWKGGALPQRKPDATETGSPEHTAALLTGSGCIFVTRLLQVSVLLRGAGSL